MPNWVFSSIVAVGDKLELDRLQAQLNAPVTKHYPETEWNKETKTWETNNPKVQQYSNPVFSFWNVIAPTDLDAYYGKEKHKIEMENFMEGFSNAMAIEDSSYWWNLRNWGTKWDIAVQDGQTFSNTTVSREDDETLMYHFETAWSPVEKIVQLLSEQYPTLEFSYEFEEEQGWGGEMILRNGETISASAYDIPSSHSDYVERGNEDGCQCAWDNSDNEYLFDDCPRKEKV